MRLLTCVTVILVSLLLAGCATPSATRNEPPAAHPFTVLPGNLVGQEPIIRAGPEGQLLVAAIGTAGANNVSSAHVVLWQSLDGGTTWSDGWIVEPPGGSNDVDVAIDADGTIWMANLWSRLPGSGLGAASALCSELGRSDDGGHNWTYVTAACLAPAPTDRPWLVANDGAWILQRQHPTGNQLLHCQESCTGLPLRSLGQASALVSWGAGVAWVGQEVTVASNRNGAGHDVQRLQLFTSDGVTVDSRLIATEPASASWPVIAGDADGAVVAWTTPRAQALTDGAVLSDASLDVRRAAGPDWIPETIHGEGLNRHAWPSTAAVTWLTTNATRNGPDAVWHLAVHRDGETWLAPGWQHNGSLGRPGFGDYVSHVPSGNAILVALPEVATRPATIGVLRVELS